MTDDAKKIPGRAEQAITGLRLRLPSDLHLELTDWAAKSDRSLNRLIVRILRQAVEKRAKGEYTEGNQSAEVYELAA